MEVNNLTIIRSEGNEGEKIVQNVPNCNVEDDQKMPNKDSKMVADSKVELVGNDADGSVQEKILKKPDKIIPCPRCNSMDTKFCYFNNYNVNQPRHFCKNCQRYWTAGGTMRNVPVGAGRRKNKHSASQSHHIVMGSDGQQSTEPVAPDLACQQTPPCQSSTPARPHNKNGSDLVFGAEGPLCESMASTLNIKEQNRDGDIRNAASRENREEPSCASSVTTPNCVENVHVNEINVPQISMQGYMNGVTPMPHFQYYPGAPWAFPWGTGFLTPDNTNPNPVPWIPPPTFCSPTLPFPLMPAASFWGCFSGWPNGAWNVPWLDTNGAVSPSSSTSNSGSGNVSSKLGKHSRESDLPGEKVEKSLWAPKTLRIDDPDEAAKSSIWATLGIKPDERCIFKPFQSKAENRAQPSDSAPLLHANPAALSRSQSFQEST